MNLKGWEFFRQKEEANKEKDVSFFRKGERGHAAGAPWDLTDSPFPNSSRVREGLGKVRLDEIGRTAHSSLFPFYRN